MMCAGTAACGPTLPTWALRQVVGYLRYTGHDASVVAKAALDPKPNIRGAAIRSPTAMTSSTAVVTFQTRHAEPGHGFSGSFFVQRATAPFQIVGIISLRIAESWRPHSRSMFRTEGCYPSSGRPRIQCGRRAFVRHRLMRQVRLLSLVRQACDAPRFAPQECATQLG
jgi:hypothetical protein